jgi:multidrug resistance efflux pump
VEDRCRQAESMAERWKTRYESVLEQQAITQCELDEVRQNMREAQARAKVELQEAKPTTTTTANGDLLERAIAEKTLYHRLLQEVLSALSKGAVTLPNVQEIISNNTTNE